MIAHSVAETVIALRLALTLSLVVSLLCVGCERAETLAGADGLDGAMCPFRIYWPPRDPDEAPPESKHQT